MPEGYEVAEVGAEAEGPEGSGDGDNGEGAVIGEGAGKRKPGYDEEDDGVARKKQRATGEC